MATDETTGKNQDTSARDSSEQSEGSTSQDTRTFTEKDVQKAISDALSKAGRDAKSLEKERQELAAWREEREKEQRRRDEQELEEARGDEGKLSQIQRERKIREEQNRIKAENEALERAKAEHAEKLRKADEAEKEINIWNIARKYGLDANSLKTDCAELGLETPEKIEAYANKHKSGNAYLHIDKSETGGTTNIDSLSPDDKIRIGLNRIKKR